MALAEDQTALIPKLTDPDINATRQRYTTMLASAYQTDFLPMVLVVDDKPTNLDVAIGHLANEAVDVRAALSGPEALELASELEPDLILLDVMMPGMTGFEVCRHLKSNPVLAHIPVIFLSAMGEDTHKERGKVLGCVDYIEKPFSRAVLSNKVWTHLNIAS